MTTDHKLFSLILNDVNTALFNARGLRDMPYSDEKEKEAKLNELVGELSILSQRITEIVRIEQMTSFELINEAINKIK